ncbi:MULTISPECIES: hypothetical protein [unclassified Mycoplasma]|uniref:hypothetical protein n=1 Tax=unclassified Mycoplasma TaxID=2683645 RepID=UPI00211B74D5|nr:MULTISPECIES: hypothetical protein [unclassified Mycoplasma]UUM19788.1 hypothetical protein NPA11_03415 [Mycoplasma sp. 1578d]UUM24772.1 hypothetical protein NPA12_03705 [Mycoplasma sp. 3686d]
METLKFELTKVRSRARLSIFIYLIITFITIAFIIWGVKQSILINPLAKNGAIGFSITLALLFSILFILHVLITLSLSRISIYFINEKDKVSSKVFEHLFIISLFSFLMIFLMLICWFSVILRINEILPDEKPLEETEDQEKMMIDDKTEL